MDLSLCRELAERGHEIHVVVAGVRREDAAACRWSPTRSAAYIRRWALRRRPRRNLRSLPLDVIHDMGVGWYCDIFHPHGGSWASVAARKVLLLPPWLRPLKHVAAPRHAAVPHFPPAHGPAVRRPRPDHGGVVAGSGGGFRADPPGGPRAHTHRLQRRGRGAILAASVLRRCAQACAAAWASIRKPSSC